MRRNVFDMLASVGGVVVVIVLAVAGSLLMVGYSFANNYVHTQLAEQQITFPSAAAFAHPDGQEITKSMIPSVSQYAGQQLLTGQQAQVYANDFIAVHLQEIGGGKTYSAAERSGDGAAQGLAGLHGGRGQGPDRLPGHHASRPAARGLRVQPDRRHRPVVCDCSLLPRRRHGGAGRPRLRPRPADRRERGASPQPHSKRERSSLHSSSNPPQ